ncbi:MAG TPA: DNA repair protein RecN [Clostridiales bacterium]|nr:DNA repair protein RecN [Clostridiales bacterium]
MIRRGENHSFIELSLYLPKNEKSIDGNIIVSREIYSNGKNSCKINGRLVTVNELKQFMNEIIDIHGQNDTQKIMNKQSHISYLDHFIGDNILNIKKEYKSLYFSYNNIKKQLKENYGDDKEKQRKIDLLQYQLREIEDAKLKEGEEEELEEQRKIMLNSEKISKNLVEVDAYLNENAVDAINMSIKSLEKIEEFNIEYKEKLSQLKSIYYDIQEIARDISYFKEENVFNESDRNEIEERLDLLYSLKRKYGNSVKEIIEYKSQIENEIFSIENMEENNKKLKQELNKTEEKMNLLSIKMNKIRIEGANKLNTKINEQLKDLEMKNANFIVKIKQDNNFNENGKDDVEFMICTNIGDEEKPLIKIASGGEVSRIMLAIKTILADSDKVPVMIFDEIDTGISGKAAKSVAEKMKIISKKHQVLCITHQANIAAKGDYNYYISKNIKGENTVTNIKLLTEDEVIKEIARISSGDITGVAIEHAKEMRRAV